MAKKRTVEIVDEVSVVRKVDKNPKRKKDDITTVITEVRPTNRPKTPRIVKAEVHTPVIEIAEKPRQSSAEINQPVQSAQRATPVIRTVANPAPASTYTPSYRSGPSVWTIITIVIGSYLLSALALWFFGVDLFKITADIIIGIYSFIVAVINFIVAVFVWLWYFLLGALEVIALILTWIWYFLQGIWWVIVNVFNIIVFIFEIIFNILGFFWNIIVAIFNFIF